MVAGGNMTFTCKGCGEKFIGWASAKRLYCSSKCHQKHAPSSLTHGESRTRLYQIWTDIKNRCCCESSPGYEYYGARGIAICEQWASNYVAFRDWALAHGYEATLEIERINVNGNYEPGNCRWSTRREQMRNTRKRKNAKTSKFKGVSRHSQNGCWIAQCHENKKTFNLGSFGTELAAALRYDDHVFETYGHYARINFPERKRASRNADVRKADAGALADGSISEGRSLAG